MLIFVEEAISKRRGSGVLESDPAHDIAVHELEEEEAIELGLGIRATVNNVPASAVGQ